MKKVKRVSLCIECLCLLHAHFVYMTHAQDHVRKDTLFITLCLSVCLLTASCMRNMTHLWRIHMYEHDFIRDMTRRYVTDSIICDMAHLYVTWCINMWHDSFICEMTHSYVTWRILTRHRTPSYVTWHMWHDLFICNMTHSYVTWRILTRRRTPSYVTWHMWHDPFICNVTHSYVTWCIHMWHDAFMWYDAFIRDMSMFDIIICGGLTPYRHMCDHITYAWSRIWDDDLPNLPKRRQDALLAPSAFWEMMSPVTCDIMMSPVIWWCHVWYDIRPSPKAALHVRLAHMCRRNHVDLNQTIQPTWLIQKFHHRIFE